MKRLVFAVIAALSFAPPALAAGNDDLARALAQLRPGAEWAISGSKCADLQWLDKVQAKPTCTEIDAVIAGFPSADTAEKSRQDAIKGDVQRAALVQRLRTASNAEIDAWLASNVTNIAQARQVLGAILKLMALDTRQ